MSAVTIFHISDLHIADPMHGDVGVEDGMDLVDAIDEDRPDILINTGDDTGSGTEDQFNVAEQITSRFTAAPYRYVQTTSNHDVSLQGTSYRNWTRDNCEEYLSKVDDTYRKGQQWPRSVYVNGTSTMVLLIDTVAETSTVARGEVGSEQIERIGAEVWRANENDLNIVMAGHHCPSANEAGLTWKRALTDRNELGTAVEEAGGVDVWLTGHLHRAAEWSNTFGAAKLFSTPMGARERVFRKIVISEDQIETELLEF